MSGDSIWRPGSNRGYDEVRDRAPIKYYRMENTNTPSTLGLIKHIPLHILVYRLEFTPNFY
jgi:hypothetical protein